MARILVIEDDRSTCELVKKLLSTGGHHVMSAREGREGIGLHRELAAEIILLDLFLPGLAGIATIRELREKKDPVKIIAMTALADVGNPLREALQAGANRTMMKPFLPKELLDTVSELLAAKV